MTDNEFKRYVNPIKDMEHLKKTLEDDGIKYVIAIGDVTVANYMKWFGKLPNIVVIDGYGDETYPTQAYLDVKDKIDQTVVMPTGSVSYELMNTMFDKVTHHEDCIFRVIGEEDGALLPALLFADEDAAAILGDPEHKRMVYIKGGFEARVYAWSELIANAKMEERSHGYIQS